MTINKIIMQLKSITGINVYPDFYQGDDDKWITFNYADIRPALSADDHTLFDNNYMQIHLYIPVGFDYLKLRTKIRDFLESSDFFNVTIQELTEKQTKHIVFECEYVTERED